MIEKVDRASGGSASTSACEDGFDGLGSGSFATIGSEDCDDFQRIILSSKFSVLKTESPPKRSLDGAPYETLGDGFAAEAIGLGDGSYEDVFVNEAASGFECLLVEVEQLLVLHEALDDFHGCVER
jgi:hypothetical protein